MAASGSILYLDRGGSAGLCLDDDGCNLLDLGYQCVHYLSTAHPGRYVERKPGVAVDVSDDIRVMPRKSLSCDLRVRGITVNP